MRILLAAKHAPEGRRPIGGVQSWCRTVKTELRNRGYDAVTWGPGQATPLGGFDLGIIANVGDTHRAVDWCSKVLCVTHGIIPAEKPIAGALTAFTSEEVRDHWNEAGPIIRQPIDVKFWRPTKGPQAYLTRFSYRAGLEFVQTLARPLGLTYYHLRGATELAVRDILWTSGVVLATGRAALEAMATGVPTVLCDHRSSYQGPLLDFDVEGAMTRNYSGRGGITPTARNVSQAIDVALGMGSMREHVIQHHSVDKIVDQLLEVA